MKELLGALLPPMQRNGCYAEALYISTRSLDLSRDATGLDATTEHDEGVKLRIHDGERYHERCLSGIDRRALRAAARTLGRIRKRSAPPFSVPTDPLDAEYTATGAEDVSAVPFSEKVVRIGHIYEILAASRGIANVRIHYDDFQEQRVYVNPYRRLAQRVHGCHVTMLPFVESSDGLRYHYETRFRHGFEATAISDRKLSSVARFARSLADAKRLPPGKYTCLLSPAVAGLLAHESFGHGMEADTIAKGRAKAASYLGRRIASKEVSIADGPLHPDAHGFFFFDDEGWLGTRARMVDAGIVRQPLTDAFNAAVIKVPRTSNARCESFDRKIYARMTNTYFEAGTEAKEELLRRVRNGLYLHYGSGGMEDPLGWGIQIQGIVAERIRNGTLTGEFFYEVGMTGYLPAVLKRITGVSKEFSIPGTGICGKGHKEWVRVAEGGPHLLIEGVPLS